MDGADVISYVVYLVMAATAVQEIRRSNHVRINDKEDQDQEQELESRLPMENSNHFNGDHFQFLLP